ncbi:MAG TPA: crossover junction endodeoxyribonuclease RuvC [Casimicrobiaceae bacterium]|nr:crossover junction endodeoxyribonuclease RuvC [Casimicrobiaceae bacterium]
MSLARVAVGYDPGSALSGFGVIAREGQRRRFLDAGTITTEPSFTMLERLDYILHQLTDVVREHRPVVLAIEDQLGMAAAARACVNAQLSQARRGEQPKFFGYNADNDGVLGAQFMAMAVGFTYRVPVILLQPKTIKVSVVGPGGSEAEKSEVKAAVQRLFPELVDVRFSSHAADGIATAVCGEHQHHIQTVRVQCR